MITGTILYTWIFGERVGRDEAGNRYYRRRGGARRRANNGREQRWVMYEGEREASRVPPEWHEWLHHTSDTPPVEMPRPRPQWRKPHQPNLTGTREAYYPPGHVLGGGKRAPATGDYEPWRPQ
ncbi:MAG: NADH:ubiquinone oxidoreductase subunit NDUFA12 [Alphaproteobacteria bacterium]|nr:NADH:ubiquinone oxidoreductase subunit NDUFA12 [Alphaproteobacteria bacterium]